MTDVDTGRGKPKRRIPLAAEVLTYVGGAFATGACLALLGTYWTMLGMWGQLGLAGLVAAAGIAGGLLIGRIEDKAAHRIEAFLLFLGVAALGGFGGILAWHVLNPLIHVPPPNESTAPPQVSDYAVFAGMLSAFVASIAVWWRHRYVMQQIALSASALLVAGSGVSVITGTLNPAPWVIPTVLAIVSFAIMALSLSRLLPPLYASLTIGSVGWMLAMQGFVQMAPAQDFASHSWLPWVGLAGSLGLLAAGVWLRKGVMIGIGALVSVQSFVGLLAELFGERISIPLVMLVVGVILIGVSVAIVVLAPRSKKAKVALAEQTAAADLAADTTAASTGLLPGPLVVRIPLAAEILGYAGGAVTAAASIALITVYWQRLGVFGQVGIASAAAIAALVGGFAIGRLGDGAAKRLEQFLEFVGVVAVGVAVGIAGFHVMENVTTAKALSPTFGFESVAAEWGIFLGSAAAATAGGAVWWVRRTAIQEVCFGLGVAASCISVLALPQSTGPYWIPGLVLLALGVAWGTLGVYHRIEPEMAALSLASLGVLGGIGMMSISGPEHGPSGDTIVAWALWLGLVTSIAMIAASIPFKRWVIMGMGVFGMVVYVPLLLVEVFPDTVGAPVAILIAGVLLLVGGVAVAIVGPRIAESRATPPGGMAA